MKIGKSMVGRMCAALSICAFGAPSVEAHLGYTNRIFGAYSAGVEKTLTISGQSVNRNYGWADGTDQDFGDSHYLRLYRFTLADPMLIYIAVQAAGGLLPGFSIYSGLADSASPDYDTTDVTIAYLATLPGVPKEGAFQALNTWRVGTELDTSFDQMTTFTYAGHAADGTSANFGPMAGIAGDGVADSYVMSSFTLPAGDYSLFVGGALYGGQSPTPDTGSYGLQVTVSNVPEPASAVMLLVGGTLLGVRRRRR